jgi:hypothetical protein
MIKGISEVGQKFRLLLGPAAKVMMGLLIIRENFLLFIQNTSERLPYFTTGAVPLKEIRRQRLFP